MTDLGRYIIEEWAEEYRDGVINRREFLRRIRIFAGGAALGVGVLATLGIAASLDEVAEAATMPPHGPARSPVDMVPPDDPSLNARMVSFPQGGIAVQAYLARPKTPARVPGVLVVHENRGLVDNTKDIARRLAKVGYTALAPDLASPGGGTANFSDSAQVTALLGQTPPEQLVAMLNAGVRYLQGAQGVLSSRVGVIGFCFGGGLTWRLLTQNADLRAGIPFYGPNPPLEDVPRIKAAVLALYGELDQRIDAGIPAMRQALEQAGVVHEIVIYPGANHAFFNDTGPNYNAAAAADAWARAQRWFQRYLGA
jgi:carboxymethylenebutenolidase